MERRYKFFARAGDKYVELKVSFDREYDYNELVNMPMPDEAKAAPAVEGTPMAEKKEKAKRKRGKSK